VKRRLTATLLEAHPKPFRRVKYGDVQARNLIVVIEPSGKVYWKWQGRVEGRVTEVHLGQFPAVGVGEARKAAAALTEARDDAKMKAQAFELPSLRKRSAPPALIAASGVSSESRDCNWLWAEYMSREGGGKAGSAEKQRSWDKDIAPFIGNKPYRSISYDDLAEVIAVKSETAPGAANHLVSYIKRLFRWAITRGRPITRLEIDPASFLIRPSETRERDRYLTNQEIAWFFMAAAALNDTFSDALVFTLYNGTRRDETFDMPWDEYDDRAGHWTIPGKRTKNGDALLLPLAPSSRTLLKARKALSGEGNYVFPALRADKPLTGFSKAMERFRNKMIEVASHEQGAAVQIPNWTIHDLRRTVSTGMHGLVTEEGYPLIQSEIVDRILNHRLEKIRRTYNKADYLPQKRRALLLWAEHLDTLRGNVHFLDADAA
jgi:integrase